MGEKPARDGGWSQPPTVQRGFSCGSSKFPEHQWAPLVAPLQLFPHLWLLLVGSWGCVASAKGNSSAVPSMWLQKPHVMLVSSYVTLQDFTCELPYKPGSVFEEENNFKMKCHVLSCVGPKGSLNVRHHNRNWGLYIKNALMLLDMGLKSPELLSVWSRVGTACCSSRGSPPNAPELGKFAELSLHNLMSCC